MKNKIVNDVFGLGEGLFAHTVDFGLWLTIYLADMMVPQSVQGQQWRARIAADKFINNVNYDSIKNAIQTARKKGWIKIVGRKAMPQITAAGKARLSHILPRYDQKRIWDERMHVITYDIPEIKRTDRWKLREFLKKIGCGMLQESVWITPYNPIDLLRDFIKVKNIKGNIIVSDLGKDGSIGDEDIRAILVRVYKLEELDQRYNNFLLSSNSILAYFAILKDDPQLPFSLLPDWWKGDKAFEKIKSQLYKVVISLATGSKTTT